MATDERDDTDEWLLPADGGPPTLYELEQRVELALTVARAAETAALEIGAASIDAAQQARRAAELAERAGLTGLVRDSEPAKSSDAGVLPALPATAVDPDAAPDWDQGLMRFLYRAQRVSSRLREIQST